MADGTIGENETATVRFMIGYKHEDRFGPGVSFLQRATVTISNDKKT